jgi:hypothetical protein
MVREIFFPVTILQIVGAAVEGVVRWASGLILGHVAIDREVANFGLKINFNGYRYDFLLKINFNTL